jgi:GT2 family glycosyltransferase
MVLPLAEAGAEWPRVALIITAWNQLPATLACLQTVAELDYPLDRLSLWLVDNGSEPALSTAVDEHYPHLNHLHHLRHEQNLGFAGGYNSGLRHALAQQPTYDYFFLLNNDTLLAPDSLRHLVQRAQTNPTWGIITAKIYYADEPERIWTVGEMVSPLFLDLTTRRQNQLDHGQWDTAQTVDFVPFCGVLLSRRLLMQVGLLDEGFFVYYEDMDYCRRALNAGWQIGLEPQAHIWHAVSSSTGGQWSPLYAWWLGQSSGRYFRKHGRGLRLPLILPAKLYTALRHITRLAKQQQWLIIRAYSHSLWHGWRYGTATTPPPPWLTTPRNKK